MPDSISLEKATTFRPGRWIADPHIQTWLSAWREPGIVADGYCRRLVALHDGDRIVVHENRPAEWNDGDRIVLLVHGLCGCHRSPYMQRVARKLNAVGIRTVRIDLRGFGDSARVSRGHSHAGRSRDVLDVCASIQQTSPQSPLTLVGFSLGGNIVLRAAWEYSVLPGNLRIDSAVAVSPPVDLTAASINLRHWGNRIYDWFFTRQLTRLLNWRRANVPGLIDNGLRRLPGRLVHFDDRFVGPINGFCGARDYYQRTSSAPILSEIEVSTLIITAEDDPLIPFEMFRRWPMSSSVELKSVRYGGHLGFVAQPNCDPDRFWLDWRIVHWITAL